MVVERPSFFNNRQALLPVSLRRHGGADNATPNLLYAYSSADGGATWKTPRPLLGAEVARFQPLGEQWSGFFPDASHWWVTSTGLTAGDGVQAAPGVARSMDAGATWRIYSPSPRILVMRFSDAEHGWAADVSGPQNTNGLLRTSDGGAHWVRVNLPARGG
jgi:hypothetical protein